MERIYITVLAAVYAMIIEVVIHVYPQNGLWLRFLQVGVLLIYLVGYESIIAQDRRISAAKMERVRQEALELQKELYKAQAELDHCKRNIN